MATNLDIQQQLNSLLEQQSKLMDEQSKTMKDQVSLAKELVSNLSKINYRGIADDIGDTQEAVEKAQESTSKFGGTSQTVFEKVSSAVGEASKNLLGLDAQTLQTIAKVGKLTFIAGNAMTGFVSGLKFSGNLMKNVISLGGGMLSFMGNLAASIISIPFKMLSGLITMADTGGNNELAQALEDIRKEFGALHDTAGKAIIDLARDMKGQLANTGLSVYRIMGNLAERLKTIAEWAKQLGPLFENLAPGILKNAEAFAAYNKGLGLTEAGLKAAGTRAQATGVDVTEVQRQIANYSVQMGHSFGYSSKLISRDMGDMMADFKHFGSLAPQTLSQVSVYARKLGIDVKALTGVIDKFDNFEDAAQGAAHLSQAFGLNIDALKLMKEQDPAARMEMIRKAFFQAGRSVETMTRQERALLTQQTGVTDDSLDLVFSLKNQAVSYADIQKKGDAAHKKQLTQAESMKALADSIERLVKSGSIGAGGFFDRFIQGFANGVKQSRQFQLLLYDIRQALQTVYYHGMQVGRMFVQMFPGIQNILGGLRDIFNPTRWRALMNEVVKSFHDFFDDLTKNPQTALPKLLDKLKATFFNFFDSRTTAGHRLLDGFKSFFRSIVQIAGSLLKLAIEGLTTGIRYIVDLISGRAHLPVAGAVGAGAGALGFLQEIFTPLLDAVRSSWRPLWQAIKDLFEQAWSRIKNWLSEHPRVITGALGVMFGPAILGTIGKTLSASLITMIASVIGRAMTSGGGGLISRAIQRLTGAASHVAEAAHGAGAAGGAGASEAGRVATGAVNAAKEVTQAAEGVRISGSTLVKLALITAVLGIGMYFLISKGLVPLARSIQEQHISVTSIVSASITMLAAAGAMTAMAGSLALLNIATRGLNAGTVGRMIIGVTAIGLFAAGMAIEGKHIINYLGDIKLADLGKATLAMAAIGTFFAAAALVTGGAALIGAFVVASSGLGSVVIGAGLVAIVTTVEVMAREGMRIIHIIDEFRPAPGFLDKTKGFAAIMEAIGSFAGNIARITEASRPSFLSFRNQGTEQRQTLAAVRSVVQVIGDGIVGIINTIKPFITQLAGSESQLKGAEALGNLLSGIGNLAKAMSPPMEQLTNHTSIFWGLIDDSGPAQSGLTAFSTAVMNMQTALQGVIETTRHAWTVITAGAVGSDVVVKEQVDLAGAFSTILGAVGTLAHALMPDPATMTSLAGSKDIGPIATRVGAVVLSIINAMEQSHLISNVARLILGLMSDIEHANFSASTIRTLNAALPAVTSIFSAVGSIASTMGTIVAATTGAHANPLAITQATNFVGLLLESLSVRLPQIVESMTTAFGSMTPQLARTISAATKAFGTVIQAVSTIMDAPMPAGGSVEGKFDTLITSLASIQRGVEGVTWNLAHSTLLGPDTEALITRIKAAHIDRIGGAIQHMVHEVNTTSAALKSLNAVNVDTQLQRVADNLGLGSTGNYTIQNRNFTIQVNLNIKFDNAGLDAFELALINRTGPHLTRLNTTRRSP